jgi:hypothetical protein
VEKLGAKIETRDEALCLYSEVVRLYQERELVRPREVNNLLARIRTLTKK